LHDSLFVIQMPMPGNFLNPRRRSSMIELRLADTTDAIDRATARVLDLCGQCAFGKQRLDEVATAVTEALRNAVEHGNGGRAGPAVRLAASAQGATVTVEIRDPGEGLCHIPPVPDLGRQIRGRGPVSGWGFYLMRCFSSEIVSISRGTAGHTLRLRFDAAPPPAPVQPTILRGDDAVQE
jgi:serine/threonine-protein kinase RsbW